MLALYLSQLLYINNIGCSVQGHWNHTFDCYDGATKTDEAVALIIFMLDSFLNPILKRITHLNVLFDINLK